MKDLNKSQLILLALLLSFVTSIATGITTVTLMDQAPDSVTVPINRIVQQTVEKIVPAENLVNPLTQEQEKLIEELKAIKPLTVSLYVKGETEDRLLGTGLFLGEDKVVIASNIPTPKEGEVYIVKSVLGEKNIAKVVPQKDFTVIELASSTKPTAPSQDNANPPSGTTNPNTDKKDTTTNDTTNTTTP